MSKIEVNNVCKLGIPWESIQTAPVLSIPQLKSSEGVVFTAPRFKVDPYENRRFAQSTYLDLAYAAEVEDAVYDSGLIEGFYLISLMDALKKCAYRDDPAYYGINYGSNKCRFVQPVYLKDQLGFECEILSIKDKNSGFLVETECRLIVEGNTKPSVVYSMIYLLLPLPAAK